MSIRIAHLLHFSRTSEGQREICWFILQKKIKPGGIITDQFHSSSMTYANPFCVELLISHENLLFTFIRCFSGFILIYFKKNLKLAVNINLAAAPRFVDKSDVLDQLRYIK